MKSMSDEDSGSWAGENEKKRLYQEYTTEPFLVAFYEGNFPDRERKEYTEQYTFMYMKMRIIFRWDSGMTAITEEEYLALPEEERPVCAAEGSVGRRGSGRQGVRCTASISREELQYLDQEDIAARKEMRLIFLRGIRQGFRSEVMCGGPGAVSTACLMTHRDTRSKRKGSGIIDLNQWLFLSRREGMKSYLLIRRI